jgi:hypothetical protein
LWKLKGPLKFKILLWYRQGVVVLTRNKHLAGKGVKNVSFDIIMRQSIISFSANLLERWLLLGVVGCGICFSAWDTEEDFTMTCI